MTSVRAHGYPNINGECMNTETQMGFDRELDARGLNCPLPILRTKKSLNDMTSGQVLKIIATDPGSVRDFEAFCKQTGNFLLLSHQEGAQYVFLLRKK
jgi:tRNA 2-thiouridine synthesizing protein A